MRKPTYKEMEELVAFHVDRVYINPDTEDWQQEHDNVHNTTIVVFDKYMTDCPGYSGRVMVVVWGGGPEFTETFIWQREVLEANVPIGMARMSEPKLTKVEIDS